MRRVLALGALLLLAGCASMPQTYVWKERWQERSGDGLFRATAKVTRAFFDGWLDNPTKPSRATKYGDDVESGITPAN